MRGPSLMTGYWNRPEATAETIRDGWLHTGDLGRMSAEGIVYLLDRAKDMIISGGSNVYAVEVSRNEAAALQCCRGAGAVRSGCGLSCAVYYRRQDRSFRIILRGRLRFLHRRL